MRKTSLNLKNKGYTLIELCIVIIIVGLLIAPAAAAYNIYLQHQAIKTTALNTKAASDAVAVFLNTYSRLPCPASQTSTRDDADYGQEVCESTLAVSSSTCTGGICVSPSLKAGAPRIRIGALPFRALNLLEEDSYDGYHSRLTYAVTESLTDKTTYNSANGAISVVDTQTPPVSAIDPPNSARYIVLSHGPNREGAYNNNGMIGAPCPGASSVEYFNCNPAGTPVFRTAQLNTSGGNNTYDDTLIYNAQDDMSTWEINNKTSNDLIFPDGHSVGINVKSTDPLPDIAVFNTGVRTDEITMSGAICDQSGKKCISPAVLGGSELTGGGIKCPDGSFVTEIENGTAKCSDEFTLSCPNGQLLAGIDNDGKAICRTVCKPANITICSVVKKLPYGKPGDVINMTQGASKVIPYTCQTSGAWKKGTESGSCTCAATTETRTTYCDKGYDGNFIQTRDLTCPAGTWSAWTPKATGKDNPACVCAGGILQENQKFTCTAGYTGEIIKNQIMTCTGGNNNTTSWKVISDTCKCTPTDESQEINCNAGLSGTITQKKFFRCPSGKWDSSWTEVARTCSCDPLKFETRDISCPDGQLGQIQQKRTINCPSGNWNDWADVTSNCVPKPPVICTWQSKSTENNQEEIKQGFRIGDNCACGAVGKCYKNAPYNQYYNYTGCSCE